MPTIFRITTLIIISLIALNMIGFVPTVQAVSFWENDKTSVVNWVIDGDTFDVTSGDRIRLADIDAPENGESGYLDAKNFLIALIYDETVYLDVDDVTGADPYDRLVCVAFVDYNATHVINVNKALLIENLAVVSNYTNNEFKPDTWTLYVANTVIPEISNSSILIMVHSSIGLTTLLVKKKFS